MPDAELQEILNEAVRAEYRTLFMLPRHLALIDDEEVRTLLKKIQKAELSHAETTLQILYDMGAEPQVKLGNPPIHKDLRKILQAHAEGERRAIRIYKRAEEKCQDPAIKEKLKSLRQDEEQHLRTLTNALDRM